MIPTVLLVGLVLGRWWWQTVLGAGVGWALVVLVTGVIDPVDLPAAAALGALNAGVGVAAHWAVVLGARVVGRLHDGGVDAGVVGAGLVLGAVVLAGLGVGGLTLVDAMLLVAVLAVVPLAVPLVPGWSARHATWVLVPGALVAGALLVEQGPVAGMLAVPWLVVVTIGAWRAARWWWRARRGWLATGWVVAASYLVVGAAWLLADRLDATPVGVLPPIVQLTAVHFHHAGFGAGVLAASTWRTAPSRGTATSLVLVLVGPPVVATGFLLHGVLQVLGALVLAVGLWLLAWQVVRHVAPRLAGAPRVLLVVSALSTLAPMVLAVQWAAGSAFGTPALSIPAMARWHGVANALGLVLLGILGWRLAADAPDAPDPGVTATA